LHPRRCSSPDAITPEQVLRHHRSAQGRDRGTGTVPYSSYQYFVFHIIEKGILQSLFHGNSYPEINCQFLKINGKQINID
jgi:hypothetical protein